MSTIGGVPLPVFGVNGSSRKRGNPRMSCVMPMGTATLSAASMQGEPDMSRKSPFVGSTNRGSALTFGAPDYIRSDNGPEFTAEAVRAWLARVGVKTLFIEPGSPWENGYIESFNGKFRGELLNGEIFYTLHEARVVIETWRYKYNHFRPHSSLGYRPPAPEAILPALSGAGSAPLRLPRTHWSTHRD